MSSGKLFNKTLSAQKIIETLLAAAARANPHLCIGALRDFKWSESSDHPDMATVDVKDCGVGGDWTLEGHVYVEKEHTPHDHRDGCAHLWIRRGGNALYPYDCHFFAGCCYQFGIGQYGYKIASFNEKPAMRFYAVAGGSSTGGFERFEEAFQSFWTHSLDRVNDGSISGSDVVSRHVEILRAPQLLAFARRVGLLDESGQPRMLETPIADEVIRGAYREGRG